ncbi:MAG: hypothetical protein ACR2L6_00585 [Gemmatimonadaceae bacterium]
MPSHVQEPAIPVLMARKIMAFVLVATLAVAGCSDSTGPLNDAPLLVRLEPLTETNVTGTVGTAAPVVPAVRATDQNGKPVAGVEIAFVTDGAIAKRAARTDADGVAAAGTWTLSALPGTNTVTARASGSEDVVFIAIARAGPIARLAHVSGNEQAAGLGATLPQRLSVKVSDLYGNPVSGATVEFAVVSGGGSIGGDPAVSDAEGVATSGLWTLGASPGAQQVKARAAGVEMTFFARGCDEPCPRGAQLLFVSNGDIFLTDLEASHTVQLTFSGRDYEPAWSPDGNRIAFVRRDVNFGRDIYLMNADGSGLVRRTTGAGLHSPAWSPDGNTLAVGTGDHYDGDIRLLSLSDNQGDGILLARMGTEPEWSPDGKKIAFVSLSGDDGYGALHVMNADGSGIFALTLRDEGALDSPTWSPDGKHIVFSKCLRNVCDLYSVDPDGATPNTPAQVTQLTQLGNAWSPDWSPDGTRIAFMRGGWLGGSIAYVTPDGEAAVEIPLSGSQPAWRP